MVLGSKSGGVGEGLSIAKVRGSADRYTSKEVTRNAAVVIFGEPMIQ